jgi:TfoX/Sxy family transcriptional regulator of competence genes
VSETHLRNLRSLIERLGVNSNTKLAIQCKHFFGGAAAYAGGRIFMTLTSRGLALKLPEESRAILIGKGATPLRYFPNGPIKKDYVVIPINLSDDDLTTWIKKSIRFAQTLPK